MIWDLDCTLVSEMVCYILPMAEYFSVDSFSQYLS